MKIKEALICILAGIAIASVFIFGERIGSKKAQKSPIIEEITKTDTLTIFDTVCVYRPFLRERRVLDTILVAKVDTVTLRDSVMLERDEVVYTDDTTFYAVVSGVMPRLDTLKIYKPMVYIRTKTVTKEVATPAPRWSFGITAGPSVILDPKGKIDYGLGVTAGLHYRF